jgi:hypothetical protein
MKGKTHQNLKAGVGWKSSDGRWSLVELSKKKERVGEQQKKGERQQGWGGRLSFYSGPDSEPGKSCCCPLLSRLSQWRAGVKPTCSCWVWVPFVRNGRGMDKAERRLKCQLRIPGEEDPSKRAGAPPVAYRLLVDIGEQSGGETPRGGENSSRVESTITRGS